MDKSRRGSTTASGPGHALRVRCDRAGPTRCRDGAGAALARATLQPWRKHCTSRSVPLLLACTRTSSQRATTRGEALAAVFAGGDWEASLRSYQERRDAAVLPFYQAAVGYAQSTAVPAAATGWLRALLGNPWHARSLAIAMPAIATTGGVVPDRL